MVSSELQKQHLLSPFQFLLAVVFYESNTFCKVHMKILILSGIFSFQIGEATRTCSTIIKSLYNLTDKTVFTNFHSQLSSGSVRFTLTSRATNSSHILSLSPTRALLKEMFSGLVLSTQKHKTYASRFKKSNISIALTIIKKNYSLLRTILVQEVEY